MITLIRLVNQNDKHSKDYIFVINGNAMVTAWGRIGKKHAVKADGAENFQKVFNTRISHGYKLASSNLVPTDEALGIIGSLPTNKPFQGFEAQF